MNTYSWVLVPVVFAACSEPSVYVPPTPVARSAYAAPVSEGPATSETEIRARMRLLPSYEPRAIIYDTQFIAVSVQKGAIWVPPYEVDADYRNPVASQLPVTVTDVVCKDGGKIDYMMRRRADGFSLGVECGGVPRVYIMNKDRGPTVSFSNQPPRLPNTDRLYFRGHGGVEVFLCDNPRACL